MDGFGLYCWTFLSLGITNSADCLAYCVMMGLLWPNRAGQYLLLTGSHYTGSYVIFLLLSRYSIRTRPQAVRIMYLGPWSSKWPHVLSFSPYLQIDP